MDSYVPKSVADAATVAISTRDSGRLHIMPDLTADTVISLPAAAAGLSYKFIIGAVTTDAQDWQVDTGSDTNFFLGGVMWQIGAGAAEFVGPDGNSNSIVNILAPEPGTAVEFICDGTNWVINGLVVAATTPAWADQS